MLSSNGSSQQDEGHEIGEIFTNVQSKRPEEETTSENHNFPENLKMKNNFVEILIRDREPEHALMYI